MRVNSPWLQKALGLGFSTLIRSWMSTLDYQAAYYDRAADVANAEFRGPVIYCIWHEYIPVPFFLRPHSRLSILTSRHADAEFVSQAGRYVGFQSVRGSTARGGAVAVREIFSLGNRRNLAIAPDGPRGPRRSFAPGPVYLSSKLGIPLVLIAPGYDRPWRMKTWDQFAVPRPGSRCRILLSPLIQIPPHLDRFQMESHRLWVADLYQQLTEQAESWASSGRRFEKQCRVFSQGCADCKLQDLQELAPSTGRRAA